MSKIILPIALFMISFRALALVDYTDQANEQPKNFKAMSKMTTYNKPENTGGSRSDFTLSTNYEISQINSNKVGSINYDMHFQTPYNIFLDTSYWQADYLGKNLSGNPKFILGFNWIKFGNQADEARLDLMAGMRLPGQAGLASTRTDKIFGLETTKRFFNFGLGLGYELTMTGNPKNHDEMSVGNIHRLSVSAGWMVSNDIQFELEAENFKVMESSDLTSVNRLSTTQSFSTLSPKINLGLSSYINFILGARYQMQRAPIAAKVFDFHGAYSNSVFTGLNFSI
jgi:hypothetical protein